MLGMVGSKAMVIIALEVLLLKFGSYLLTLSSDLSIVDYMAYFGYKFIG